MRLRPRWFWGDSPWNVLLLVVIVLGVPLIVWLYQNAIFKRLTHR